MELIGANLGMVMALRMAGRELGDCPNIEMKTMGGRKFWITSQEKQGWKLQTNKITKLSRILDENNRRKAWGNPVAMAEKFKRLLRQEFLEPGDVIGVARKISKTTRNFLYSFSRARRILPSRSSLLRISILTTVPWPKVFCWRTGGTIISIPPERPSRGPEAGSERTDTIFCLTIASILPSGARPTSQSPTR